VVSAINRDARVRAEAMQEEAAPRP
jgi:hypothetical protein